MSYPEFVWAHWVNIPAVNLSGTDGTPPWLRLYQKNLHNLEYLIHFPVLQSFYELCFKTFQLNIWASIPIQWFENTSGFDTVDAKNQLHISFLC